MLPLLAVLLIGQSTVPTPTQEAGWTDPETGEIVYPLEQRPADAMARGCLFGRATVRCPNPSAPVDPNDPGGSSASAVAEAAPATSPTPLDTSLDTSDFYALFPEVRGFGKDTDGAFGRINAEAVEAEAVAAAGRSGRSEPESSDGRPTCHREERRSADGSSTSVQVVCGSGDQELMDDVMERLRPNER